MENNMDDSVENNETGHLQNDFGSNKKGINTGLQVASEVRRQTFPRSTSTEVLKLPQRSRSTHSQDSGYGSIQKNNKYTDNTVELKETPVSELPNAPSTTAKSSSFQEALEELSTDLVNLSSTDLEGKTIGDRDYVAALLTHIGGYLSIPDHNISLYVPPDALPDVGIHLVYVHLLSSITRGPGLTKGETWLTPLVECGPPGLKFKSDVFLTMPHCAENTESGEWAITAHQGTHDKTPQWKRLHTNDPDIISTLTRTGKGVLTFPVRHFTIFGASGTLVDDVEGTSDGANHVVFKWIEAIVMIEDVDGKPNQQRIIVKLRNSFGNRKDNINTSVRLRIDNSGANVVINVSELGENWNIVGESRRVIDYEKIWSEYFCETNGDRSATFVIQTRSSDDVQGQSTSSIIGVVHVHQDPNDDHAITIPAVVELSLRQNQPTGDEDGDERGKSFLERQPYYKPSTTSLGFFEDIRFRKLCVILDGTNDVGRGWQTLASQPQIGIKEFIYHMAIYNISKGEGKSPSVLLLNNFFENIRLQQHTHASSSSMVDAKGHEEEALMTLKDAFQTIDNKHAELLVDEELEERKSAMESRCAIREVARAVGTTPPVVKNSGGIANEPGRIRESTQATIPSDAEQSCTWSSRTDLIGADFLAIDGTSSLDDFTGRYTPRRNANNRSFDDTNTAGQQCDSKRPKWRLLCCCWHRQSRLFKYKKNITLPDAHVENATNDVELCTIKYATSDDASNKDMDNPEMSKPQVFSSYPKGTSSIGFRVRNERSSVDSGYGSIKSPSETNSIGQDDGKRSTLTIVPE